MINLNALAKKQYESTKKRATNPYSNVKADPISCLKHAAGEVVEATEAYTRLTCAEARLGHADCTLKQDLVFELADIICCVMSCAAQLDVDLEDAISDRVANNMLRADGIGDKA